MPADTPQWIRNLQVLEYSDHTMNAVQIYKYLIEKFDDVDVSKDTDFQDKYKEFFVTKLSLGGDLWHQLYFNFLQELKNKYKGSVLSATEFEAAIRRFYQIRCDNGLPAKVEPSFVSKAFHMVNHNLAIWDSKVRANLHGLTYNPISNAGSIENKIRRSVQWYNLTNERIQNAIALDKNRDITEQIIAQFRAGFPNEEKDITDIKIMDFYYWQLA